jgi:predicted transcriptional regulator
MKRNHKLIIGVSTLKQSLKETLDACKKAKNGLPIGPVHRIDFTDQAALFGTLSPKRMELLRYLRQSESMSARQIAKNLGRDYKNIQVDIKLLSRLELIVTNEEGRYSVPWDDISIELALVA